MGERPTCPKLQDDNYAIWKWQFTNCLRASRLDSALAGGATAEIDAQALALLGSFLSEDNILKIFSHRTFIGAWQALERCFETKTSYEPQYLYRQLNSYTIESSATVSKGISEMKGIVAKLANLNEKVSDNCFIGAILSALPPSFDIFVTVWKNSSDKNVESFIAKLMAEANSHVTKEEIAMIARHKNSRRKFDKDTCKYCKNKGHWIKNCPNLKTPYDPDRNRKNQEKSQGHQSTNLARTQQSNNGVTDQIDLGF